ncbi:o-succinylbenzoate synthase [Nodosilinea sp. LEGE 07088]|uniref:o-succinylbenzoate synthase n=1 Tax=Nodosilinea sp. LEGE 07088 TaxID=2777968 RepID=UPI00187F8642|nr:o-succinylbenzoate synthase [Nodosilinea sp. LEGE 07088]MBE9136130.1 o-succinylbenzoate synthase [Nodosilinea sp. LEGE 07088]
MGVDVAVRAYRRQFARPLKTAHGSWRWREGLLVQLRDSQARVGYGEIAPIPWFGTETVADALAFCQTRGGAWQPGAVPNELSATQFGLACALADLTAAIDRAESAVPSDSFANADICGLLPTGAAALAMAHQPIARGHRTLKWKIGVQAMTEEIQWLEQLIEALPHDAQLRLDANGGLSLEQAEQWLTVCDRINADPHVATIAYLEQPLPPDRLAAMQTLAAHYQTAIALDESVATLAQLEACWARGWRGVVVVKPAIAGLPQRLQAFCQAHHPRVVFSSAFETRVGRQAALALACHCAPEPAPALGFDTQGWFADDWDTLTPAELWDRL